MLYLLQGGRELLELGSSIIHKQQSGKGVVEDCPIARVLFQKGKVVAGVMVEHKADSFQLLHQLATHIP